ncbi:MAG: hypothetical protein PHU12_02995 [Candidatus Aenigmarchaeota archaeon]|nr:hypothetical protein [Candidatus Aenigmarchaeota archaeon]
MPGKDLTPPAPLSKVDIKYIEEQARKPVTQEDKEAAHREMRELYGPVYYIMFPPITQKEKAEARKYLEEEFGNELTTNKYLNKIYTSL